MRRPIPAVTVRRDDRALDSETLAAPVGAHVVVFSSTVPDLGVSLHTVYGGAEGTDTAVTQLTLTRHGARQRLERVPRDAIPVTHARDRCLLDHLHRLRDALQTEAPDAVVAIDASEAALAAAAHAWARGP